MEPVPATLDIPAFLELQSCCLDQGCKSSDDELNACCYKYHVVGAIVHVVPKDNEEALYGESTEGHYVTFVNKASSTVESPSWFEIDDSEVNKVDQDTCRELSQSELALKVMSGCNVTGKEQERRFATMVVYSRSCDCVREIQNV